LSAGWLVGWLVGWFEDVSLFLYFFISLFLYFFIFMADLSVLIGHKTLR